MLLLLERVFYLQQRLCNDFHHTLNMSLHYLGKWKGFKFAANLEAKSGNALILHAPISTDLAY